MSELKDRARIAKVRYTVQGTRVVSTSGYLYSMITVQKFANATGDQIQTRGSMLLAARTALSRLPLLCNRLDTTLSFARQPVRVIGQHQRQGTLGVLVLDWFKHEFPGTERVSALYTAQPPTRAILLEDLTCQPSCPKLRPASCALRSTEQAASAVECCSPQLLH